jgi:hypothetical protein
VGRVAVAAAEVAGGEPDESAGQARADALALDAALNLVNHKAARRLVAEGSEPMRSDRAT